MKRTARLICCLLVLVTLFTLFAACNKTETKSPEDSSKPEDGAADTSKPEADDGQGNDEPDSQPADDVKYAEHLEIIIDNTQIAAINPIGSGGPGSATGWVYKMVYDTLVASDGEGGYLPNLAAEWESDDWKTVTFTLRDDVVFSNGEPLTADDVAFTIEQALLNPGSVAGGQWTSVESVKAIDKTTVELTLKNVHPQILFDASMPYSSIMCKKAVEQDPEKGVWVGTGTYVITDFASNDSVSLARNEKYWGELPPTKTMTLRYIPELSTRFMMLQNGEADACFNLSEQDLPLIAESPDVYNMYTYTANNCSDIGFNMKDPICGDYNFRMAVASALNREDIAMGANGIYATAETTGTFWGSGTPFRNNDIPIIPYDLDKAREYLEASPYNGEEIELVTSIVTMINASEVIQQQLSEIGINIKIKQTDPASIMSYATYNDNQCQMFCFVGAFSKEPYTSSYGIFYPGGMQNRTTYDNPEIVEILDKAASEADPAKQQEYYYKLQELVAEDIPYLNLFYVEQVVTTLKAVGGLKLENDGSHDLRYMYKIVD